jgi:8-oxo-dGTP pyrophosphatase MutT (NUDIX family)
VIFLRGTGPATEILLQLRQNTGYRDGHWATAAAGHVEAGESVFAAARREATEELGLTQVDLTPLTAMHRTTNNGRSIDERVDFFLRAMSWQGEPRIMEPQKCAALDWFPLNTLPEPVVPHELSVFRSLCDGSVPAIVAYGFPSG